MAERTFTDLELERLLADDLPADRARALETTATEADRARLAELRAEREAFLAEVDVAAEVRGIGRKLEALAPAPSAGWFARWQRWLVAGGTFVAAGAAILLLVVLRSGEPRRDDDVGIKGDGVTLILHTPTGRLASGDTVAPGDRIRFEVRAPRAGFVAIAGIDGSARATVYVPEHDREPIAYDPARDGVLPGAIELDATPGDERFYALFSTETFELDAALAGLKQGALPAGVTSAEVVLNKRAP